MTLKKYDIHPIERLPSGHTLPWCTWGTANGMRSGQAATLAAKHLWGYRESKTCMCDLGNIKTNCRHFGERLNRDDMATLEGQACVVAEHRYRHDMMMLKKKTKLNILLT